MRRIFLLVSCLIFLGLPSFVLAETIISSSEDYINEDTTWTAAGNPYFINSHIYISASSTLTIEPGVEIRMQNGRKFNVLGTLNILGTEGNKVTITVQNEEYITDNNFTGRWGGFVFYEGSKGDLSYADAKYAGGYIWPQPGGPMIYNNGGDVSIKNLKISKTYSDAILSKSGTTTIENTLIDQNSGGISFEYGYLSLVDSIISNSTGRGFGAFYDGRLFLRNNTFSNNKYNAYLNLNIDFDIASTTFIGGDFGAWAISGSPIGERTLSPMGGQPIVTNGFIIESGNRLTIEPGVIIKGQNGGYIINRGGVLNIEGTKDNPVIFTTVTDDTVGGDTNNDGNATNGDSLMTGGIQTESDGVTNISNVFLKYANGGVILGPWNIEFGSLINTGGTLHADNIHISEARAGIYHYSGTTTITNGSLSGSMNNSIAYYFGELNIHNSSFLGYTSSYSLWNGENSGVPDVRNNYWGTPEGPYHETQNVGGTAAMILGDANFIPFLTEPPSENQTIDPVIIIPGIMGSAYRNGELVIDPILHTYDDLITTLIANGYIENRTLFTFPYEWRDSNVITANLLKDKINQVKQICVASNLPDINCNRVDLIAHSMGGLVAREYIQSGQYQYDVDQLIFLGTPHKGSPKSYLIWEAGEFPSGITEFLIKLKFTTEALRNFYPSLFDYIRNRPISSVQELLPTFDYLKDKDTGVTREYPNDYPRNIFLEALNANISDLLNSGVKITNIIGIIDNSTIEKILVIPTTDLERWTHGKESGFEYGIGDKTVTKYGVTLESLSNVEKDGKDHTEIVTTAEGDIIKILTGKDSVENVDHGIIHNMLVIQLHSPIDVIVTAPDGKRVGKDFETGQIYNEIPLAFYSGYQTDDEFITIPNPLDGEYKVELQGTGDGGKYGVLMSYISDNFATTTEITGLTQQNQITNLSINIDNENPENLESKKKVTEESLIADINKAYDLGWFKNQKIRDNLIWQIDKIFRSEEISREDILRSWVTTLEMLLEDGKITQEAYNLIKTDVEYLINN